MCIAAQTSGMHAWPRQGTPSDARRPAPGSDGVPAPGGIFWLRMLPAIYVRAP